MSAQVPFRTFLTMLLPDANQEVRKFYAFIVHIILVVTFNTKILIQ